MSKVKYFIAVLRPNHWVKNFFVIIPVIFSKKIGDLHTDFSVLMAFVLFCLASGSVYIFNDLLDVKNDSSHPIKSKRPLASGKITSTEATIEGATVLSVGLLGSFSLNYNFGIVVLIYVTLNLLYTLYLKHIVIIDVLCIAAGFVLRVVAGGIIVEVPSSPWIIMSTLFIAMFLGFSKRRGELSVNNAAPVTRPVLSSYNEHMIDQFLIISATGALMAYTLFTVSDYAFKRFGTHNLIYTTPFVIYGIFRYYYLIHSKRIENPTDILYSDLPMILNIFLWVATVLFIIGI